ncbi:uncharacterized protein LOC131659650 [Vicia villosa]|uniref:uncharacterized protein LOC131659650 n=1 Tax=Vicia villosa TaxID=3911 RepID=UPI00273BD08E|nr:uncharacterized protein LOC131659650 [Vicia villosa]
MSSKWHIGRFSAENDFGLRKVNMQAYLTQMKSIKALKGVASILSSLKEEVKIEMVAKRKKSIVEQLVNFHKIIDDLRDIDVKIDDEDKNLLLLRLLPRSFEYFMDTFLYGKEGTITLNEVHTAVRSKEFSNVKDLKIEDSGEGLKLLRGMGDYPERGNNEDYIHIIIISNEHSYESVDLSVASSLDT